MKKSNRSRERTENRNQTSQDSGLGRRTTFGRFRARKEQPTDAPSDKSHGTLYSILDWMIKPSEKFRLNRQILVVAYVFAFLFVALMVYIGYYVAVPSKEDVTSSYNPRQNLFQDRILKGELRTSDDKVIAKSVDSASGKATRTYPYGRLFCHVAGYDIYGKSGLENSANYYMYDSHANLLERVVNDLKDEKNIGDTVYTTLDYDLQQTAYNALGNYKGAVVVMEPSTGKILAMVSKPDYDPNQLADNWDWLNEDADSTLLNRATQGLYPPGSTFKIVTALEYMRENSKWNKFQYTCTGTTTVDSVHIKCAGNTAHGALDLSGAMAKSCNCSFVTLASGLRFGKFRDTANSLLFNQSLPIRLEYSKSRFELRSSSEESEMPQTAIGQGDTLITPLLNCMIISAVANDGVMMTPYLIDHVQSYDGTLVKKFTPSTYKEVMTEEESDDLTQMLVSVVEGGTASALSGLAHDYAGKTGSAEHAESSQAHAWFVGFSPVKNPEIAVCVIAEDGGSGSSVAVPIAKQIFTTYYEKNK